MGKSSGPSAANAICDHMHDWWWGSHGQHVSMAVISDNNPYGIPDNLIYSFPVEILPGGEWKIAAGLDIDEF